MFIVFIIYLPSLKAVYKKFVVMTAKQETITISEAEKFEKEKLRRLLGIITL